MIAEQVVARSAHLPQQAAMGVVLVALLVAAHVPRIRAALARHPVRALAVLVLLDFCYMLWASLPFLPLGVDEAYYAINVHVHLGDDLYYQFYRPPLPGLLGALAPWHPPLPGLLLKECAVILVFALARRPLGDMAALLAALLTALAPRLTGFTVQFLGAPFEAFFVAAFTLLAARGKWHLAALAAGLGFVSRWQIGALLPLAMLAGFLGGSGSGNGSGTRGGTGSGGGTDTAGRTGRRILCALLAAILFSVPAAILVPWTGSDPFRSYQYNTGWGGTPLSRLVAYLAPKISLGLTVPTLLLLLVGIWASVFSRRKFRRAPELMWAGSVFVTYVCAVLAIGTIMPNYFIPHTPVAAVLVATGGLVLVTRFAWLSRPLVQGVLTVLVVVHFAAPIKPPKVHARKLASPVHAVYQDKNELLRILGDEPLYTDMEFLSVTAVLAHPCHAVVWERSQHHGGVSMDWEGKFPDVARGALPGGVWYLTIDPAGRTPAWSGGGFALVRW